MRIYLCVFLERNLMQHILNKIIKLLTKEINKAPIYNDDLNREQAKAYNEYF